MEEKFFPPMIMERPKAEQKENQERFIETLNQVSQIESLSGQEEKMRQYIEGELERMAVQSERDAKGNIWIHSDSPEGEILLCAHMDKVGKGCSVENEGGRVKGRFDDAFGISAILEVLKNGKRPSALFTVEEECETEVANEAGEIGMKMRDLGATGFNAGANFAVGRIEDGEVRKPKMVVNVDVSAKASIGEGPLIYQSCTPFGTNTFRFPSGALKDVVRIVNKNEMGAKVIHGGANDAIEFTFAKNVGVVTVQVPVENMHSTNELADLGDMRKAIAIIELILDKHAEIKEENEIPTHAIRDNAISL